MLATMETAIEDLRPTQARSEGQRDLAELQQVRDALRKDRVATTNRGKHLRTPVGRRLTKQRLRQIERQLKVIDAEIRRRLDEEKTLERRAEILTSIPGISDITAAGLIVHIPELGMLTGPRAASLAGLAPVTRHRHPVRREGAQVASVRGEHIDGAIAHRLFSAALDPYVTLPACAQPANDRDHGVELHRLGLRAHRTGHAAHHGTPFTTGPARSQWIALQPLEAALPLVLADAVPLRVRAQTASSGPAPTCHRHPPP